MTVLNKEGKTHSTVNETFQSGSASSGSNAACSPSSSLCKSGRYSVTFLAVTVTDDLHMDGLLASSDLAGRPSSQSPAVDIVLVRPLAGYQDVGGPLLAIQSSAPSASRDSSGKPRWGGNSCKVHGS